MPGNYGFLATLQHEFGSDWRRKLILMFVPMRDNFSQCKSIHTKCRCHSSNPAVVCLRNCGGPHCVHWGFGFNSFLEHQIPYAPCLVCYLTPIPSLKIGEVGMQRITDIFEVFSDNVIVGMVGK